MFQKRKINLLFFLLPVIIVANLATVIIVFAWTEPTAGPPGDNVPAPLNVGSSGQSKVGGLILNTGGAATGLIIDKGNVGIGTTVPITTLNVYKNYTFNNSNDLYSQNPFPGQLILGDNAQRLYLGAYYQGGVYSGSAIQSSDYYSSADHGRPLLLNPNGGNVGIGTTSPGYKLDVNGDINLPATGFLRIAGSSGVPGQVLTATTTGMIWQTAAAGGVGGSGTADFIPRFKDATTLENSLIKEQWYAPLADGKRFVIIGENANAQAGTPRLQIFNKNDEILALVRQGDLGMPLAQTTFRIGTDKATVISDLDYDYLTLKKGGVGIGTTDPSTKLYVKNSPASYQKTVVIEAQNPFGVAGPILSILGTGTNTSDTTLEVRRMDIENKKIAFSLMNAGQNNGLEIKMPPNSNDVYFDLIGLGGDGEIIIKRDTGNVGIGTYSDPTAKLDINGQIRIRQGGPGPGEVLTSADATGLASWEKLSEISGWTRLGSKLYPTNIADYVGIGTTDPQNKLDVAGGLTVTGMIFAGKGLGLSDEGAYKRIQSWENEPLAINPIANNVGIGTTSPVGKLSVSDTITSGVKALVDVFTPSLVAANDWTMGSAIRIGYGAGQDNYTSRIVSFANPNAVYSTRLQLQSHAVNGLWNTGIMIDESGNVGIGTTSPTTKLDINGQVRIRGGSPTAGKVLTSGDGSGLATWQGIKVDIQSTIKTYSSGGTSSGTETVNCQSSGGWLRIACSGGVIHTGVNENEDNEAFIVRPSAFGCEIKWEDDPWDPKTVEVYAYCLKF